jgi:hypothetical protein
MKIMRFLCILGLLLTGTTTFAADGDMIVNGKIGVGTASPASKLDVNGDVRVGNSSTSCTASNEGAVRYNNAMKTLEFCNSAAWRTVTSTSQADAYTKLLLHMDGTAGSTSFIDSSATARSVSAFGNAQISASQYRFGGASGFFDGSGDYLRCTDSDDFSFGSGDFTVDLWVNFYDLTAQQHFVGQWDNADYVWNLAKTSSATGNKLRLYFTVGSFVKAYYTMTNNWSPVANTWYHIAFVRNGSNVMIFIDGVSQELTVTTAIGTNDVGNIESPLYVGTFHDIDYYLNGWIDELRISKGIARWTSNFTPPAAPY